MRPFPQAGRTISTTRILALARPEALLFLALLTAGACTLGCAGVGVGTVAPPPPPPTSPSISVTVTPSSAPVILGNSQTFTATVANTSDSTVAWSVNGVPGGTAAAGTITAAGVYTAPADLPSSAIVQVTATSQADATKSTSAKVTITSDVQIALGTNAASVELGAIHTFHADITSAGHPDSAVLWALSGAACPFACGTVDTNGNFTAPQILPSPASATLTAQSAADSSKRASATLTITSNFTLQISAPASVPVAGSAAIAATFTPVPGSNPAQALAWSLSGAGCNGASCGVLTVVTEQSAGGGTIANSATYNAPSAAPSPNSVTITVTPQADPSKRASAALTIQQVQQGGSVSVSPATATLAANHRVTLTAQVSALPGTGAAGGVTWSVNGVAGGSGSFGQICVVATNPCQPVTSGTAAQVDYLAPGAIPSPNPVTVQATSAADPTKQGSAQITILNHVVVTVQPVSATLAPLAVQGFTATVVGTGNQSVVWQVQGTPCAGGTACGSIAQNGAYTAPGAAPSPDAIQVVAISEDDTSQSGSANVTISTGASILSLHPASVYAGGADGFTLRVDGSGFTASSPGPGSALLIGGTARTTACGSATECTSPVTAADVAAPGSVTVQVQNPGGTKSNAVSLIVAAPNGSDEIISLTSAAPAATAEDIVVVEPTTAGVSVPGNDVDLNVEALGTFSTTNIPAR